jgi:hypothetical protein
VAALYLVPLLKSNSATLGVLPKLGSVGDATTPEMAIARATKEKEERIVKWIGKSLDEITRRGVVSELLGTLKEKKAEV